MKSLFDLFNKPKTKDRPKKIISFDGGGVRAIAGIIFLNKFENATGKKVSDIFCISSKLCSQSLQLYS